MHPRLKNSKSQQALSNSSKSSFRFLNKKDLYSNKKSFSKVKKYYILVHSLFLNQSLIFFFFSFVNTIVVNRIQTYLIEKKTTEVIWIRTTCIKGILFSEEQQLKILTRHHSISLKKWIPMMSRKVDPLQGSYVLNNPELFSIWRKVKKFEKWSNMKSKRRGIGVNPKNC